MPKTANFVETVEIVEEKEKEKSFIQNLELWGFWTVVSQFVIFLFTFLLLCAAYGFVTMSDEPLPDDFISKFEVNLLLTALILLIIPFGLSFLLIYALQRKDQELLGIWFKAISIFSSLYLLGLLASGIYLSIERGGYISYSFIAISVILSVYMVISIFILRETLVELNKKSSEKLPPSRNSV